MENPKSNAIRALFPNIIVQDRERVALKSIVQVDI